MPEVRDQDPSGSTAHDPRVAAVLADLDQLADLPVEEHPGVYEAVHAKLRAVLDGADPTADPAEEPGGP
ncbi:hypothetical protein CLV56_2847 [Mumia flava]|uniref:Uncharacterized protein n=1 Tax=Mumia flava TaxID=1348852 RepID=A0A2M9B5Z3_9ACTN|nr:hypothetical protein [Mumia flava]PJJ53360.1 hypothetical protein CLV56_2847 [Mumia flava]